MILRIGLGGHRRQLCYLSTVGVPVLGGCAFPAIDPNLITRIRESMVGVFLSVSALSQPSPATWVWALSSSSNCRRRKSICLGRSRTRWIWQRLRLLPCIRYWRSVETVGPRCPKSRVGTSHRGTVLFHITVKVTMKCISTRRTTLRYILQTLLGIEGGANHHGYVRLKTKTLLAPQTVLLGLPVREQLANGPFSGSLNGYSSP
mmetsp:Transcript_26962/g.58847  ORF Transcript_26962/g.58847 Transcript_26962/m.58847 type:complete len:204 (+) Transcript_26962:74-685(+)